MFMKITNRIIKRSKKGFHGYPMATVAYYGPDNTRASKVAVGIIKSKDAEPIMKKWYTEMTDARLDEKITNEIMTYPEKQCRFCGGGRKDIGLPT
jgi:hypothetical protein